MSKQATRTLVPDLRFPEFRDVGEWEEKKFGELCKFIRGPFGGALKKDIFVENGYAVYEQSHAIHRNFNSFRYYISKEKFDELKRFSVQPNDIIMSCSGTMGKFAIVPEGSKKGVINQALLKLTVKNGQDLQFIKAVLELPINQERLLSQSAGGAIKNVVSVGQIKEIGLHIPGFQEQQKIADCLSSIDELVTAQTQKLDALKAHKKGLMQQLFPLDGETVPKLRFPEFRDAGEWEEKKLGELSQIVRGGSPRPIDEYITSDINGLSWLKIGDVDQGSKYVTSTKEKVLVTALSKTREVNPGDLIMSNSMSFGRPYILKIKSCIHDGWIAVTKIDERANRDYLYYLILSPTSQEYFLNNAAGSGVQNLNADIIKLLPVVIPGYSEQQIIADCLSSIDELVAAQTQKLDALKAHKKGLMQELFPSANEVIDE